MSETAKRTGPLQPGPDGGIGVIVAATTAASQLGAIGKDGQAKGKGFSFGYRSSDALWDALHTVFPVNGLLWVPTLERTESGVRARGWLYWTDGSALVAEVAMPYYPDPQDMGGVMSYASRYLLSQIMALAFNDPRTEVDAAENRGRYRADERPPDSEPEPEPTEPMANPADVDKLRDELTGAGHIIQAAYKSEAAKVAKLGGSWSLAASHRWTEFEFAAARAWVDQQKTTEPFPTEGADTSAQVDVIAQVVATVNKSAWSIHEVVAAWNRVAKDNEKADGVDTLAENAGHGWVRALILGTPNPPADIATATDEKGE